MSRIVNLDVNESGAWKRVTSFDLDYFEDGELEHCADALLRLSSNPKLKARIIAPGEVAPLMTWSNDDPVWREWRAAA